MKDAENRIVGQGNVIVGKLKELENKLKQIPRDAVQRWKKFVDAVRNGEMLDSLKAEKLKSILNVIPKRVLKDAEDRIVGQGNKIKGRLRELENKLKQIPRDAINRWKDYVNEVKTGAILENLKA